ncbi:hypothetical protein [Streptomyces sp. NPDC005507]
MVAELRERGVGFTSLHESCWSQGRQGREDDEAVAAGRRTLLSWSYFW